MNQASDRARAVIDADFIDDVPVVPVENLRPIDSSDAETPREVGAPGTPAPPPADPGASSPRGVYGRGAHAAADLVEVVASGADGAGRVLRFAGRPDLGDATGRAAETARRAAEVVRTVGSAADLASETGGKLKDAWERLKRAANVRRAEPRVSVRAERKRKADRG